MNFDGCLERSGRVKLSGEVGEAQRQVAVKDKMSFGVWTSAAVVHPDNADIKSGTRYDTIRASMVESSVRNREVDRAAYSRPG